MCTNSRFIRNSFDGRRYLVSCGHCEACRQEKADLHVKRILHEQISSPSVGVFITLSYENQFVPYIKKSDVLDFVYNKECLTIPIYRDGKVISKPCYDDLSPCFDFYDSPGALDFKFIRKKLNNGCYRFLKDKVSVVYLRDIQLFFKRLKIRLVRDGYSGYFSYYYASEYGEKYNRCHFHILAFVDKDYYQRFRLLVDKSWDYADLLKFKKQPDSTYRQSIEVAKNPSKYVSSYLNCRDYLPAFLQKLKPFKPFTHFSNGFGCNFKEFTLPSLLEKIYSGTLRFNYTKVVGGVSTISSARIPKYVLNRFFPKFKGYRYLSSDALVDFIRQPLSVFKNFEFIRRLSRSDISNLFSIVVRLKRKILRAGVNYLDWLFAYPRVWSIYASESIVDSYDGIRCSDDLFTHYDNIVEYYSGDVRNDFLDGFPFPSRVFVDPNDFPARVYKSDMLRKKFIDSVKHHVVKNSYYEESFAI